MAVAENVTSVAPTSSAQLNAGGGQDPQQHQAPLAPGAARPRMAAHRVPDMCSVLQGAAAAGQPYAAHRAAGAAARAAARAQQPDRSSATAAGGMLDGGSTAARAAGARASAAGAHLQRMLQAGHYVK